MIPTGASRRFLLFFILAGGLVSILFIASYRGPVSDPASVTIVKGGQDKPNTVSLHGKPIAPKLGNATIK